MSHLGDAISAYLDGELGPAELAAADQHLAGCRDCRSELAATSTVRNLLRGAPAVEPPFGWLTRIEREWRRQPARRRSPLLAVTGVAAVAAVWLVVLGIAGPAATVESAAADLPVAELAASHTSAQQELGIRPPSNTASTTTIATAQPFETVALDELPAEYVAPNTLGDDLALARVGRRAATVQLVYTDGQEGVSVFEQPGTVEWSSLPAGQRIAVGRHRAWSAKLGGMRLLVIQDAGLAFLIVGSDSSAIALRAAETLPLSGSPSLGDRARGACRSLVQSFSLGT